MTSSQGTEYYLKSMNGIKSFDDGSGTVIEDDTITVANLTSNFISCETIENTGTFYSMAFSAGTLETSFISSATGNLRIGGDITTNTNISAGSIGATGSISAGSISAGSITATGSIGTTGNIGATGSISGGSLITNTITATTNTSNANLYSGSTGSVSLGGYGDILIGDKQTTGILYLGTTPSGRTSSVILGASTCNTQSRGPIVGNLGVKTATIQPIVNSNACNIYTDCTADTKIGGVGTIFVGQTKSSGFIAMGGGCQTIMNGELICHQNLTLDNSTAVNVVSTAAAPVNLFNTVTTGTINFGTALTTGLLNIGKFILGDQSIQALVNSTTTNLFTNLTNLLVIGGLCNILLGSSSAGRTTQIQGETLRLGQSTGTTTIFGNFISGSSKIFGYNRYLNFGASNNINGVDVDLELYILYTGSAAATFTLPNLNVNQLIGQVIRFKNGKTAGTLTIAAYPGQFIYTNTNVTFINVPVLGTATLLCPVGTGWVQF